MLYGGQDRMHLDCVFSILGDNVCLMLEEMMGAASATRRLVDEYTRDSTTGKYSLSRENVEFSQYMRDNGYHIIPIKPEHQIVSILTLNERMAHTQNLSFQACKGNGTLSVAASSPISELQKRDRIPNHASLPSSHSAYHQH